jgi:hypothetical protein
MTATGTAPMTERDIVEFVELRRRRGRNAAAATRTTR